MPQRAPSADPAEIARFDALARDWWDPNGPMKPLHRMNPIRLAYLREVFAEGFGREGRAARFDGLDLLDIGCGAGLLAEPLARQGFSVTGIDLAPSSIEAAKAHAAAQGLAIDYRLTDLAELPPEPAYDAITLLEVVEHLPDPAGLVAEAARRLRPGGWLIGSTLNRTLKSYALAILGAEYVLRWLPIGTHDWDRFVPPADFARWLEAAGLEAKAPRGMVFNPLAGSWSLSPDCDVNYLIAAQKPA